MLTRFIDGYFRLLKALIAVCLTCMVVLVLSNVILRYAFNSGITLSEEVSRWLFVYLVFLGAIVALRERGHLGMDSLVSRLSPLGKQLLTEMNRLGVVPDASHSSDQVLFVTSGKGIIATETEEKVIGPGDIVHIVAEEKHWHGAAPTTAMTHLAIQEQLDGKAVDWLEKVSDEQYYAGLKTE